MSVPAPPPAPDPRRWRTLVVLCLSVFLIVVDNTIVNVALPTLVRDLGATTSQLQWIVDAYTLVFAGLLLAAGSIGDRYGRARVLRLGLVLFGLTSVLAARAGTADQLIAARAAMGVGAALIFPATLAILTNVFTVPKERAQAIGIWSAVSGLSVAVGPVLGGWLLEHFWWGSVFLVNVPLVIIAIVAGLRLVPESRDPGAATLDVPGLLLSVTSITVIVWAIIEAPGRGWTDPVTLGAFAAGAVLLGAFIGWERHTERPMLDVGIFRNLRFTAASLSVTVAFFSLFGFIFMITQYFQFVRGYGSFEAGLRTLPFAIATGIAAPFAPKIVDRVGTKAVVAVGLLSMATGFLVASTLTVETSYSIVVVSMVLIAAGLGLTMAPATESIMGSLPPERAGIGSAVNDTTRELGGTLGVAIAGSLLASVYTGELVDKLTGTPVPGPAIDAAKESVGAAYIVAGRAGEQAGPAAAAFIRNVAGQAFVDGLGLTSKVLAGVAVLGAIAALALLPARATAPVLDPGDEVDADVVDVDLDLGPDPTPGRNRPAPIDLRPDPLLLPPLAGDLHADRLEP